MQTKTTFKLLGATFMSVMLAACGGADSGGAAGGGSGGVPSIRIGSGTDANFIPTKLTIDDSAESLYTDQTTIIKADIVDRDGKATDTTYPVIFSSRCLDAGTSTITGGTYTLAVAGKLTAEYKAGSCFGEDTVRATIAPNNYAEVTIHKINNKGIGSGINATFTPSKISVSTSPKILLEGDETLLSVNIVNNKNEAVEQATEVTFSSDCINSGESFFLGGKNTATSISGAAQLTYKVGKCSVNDTITASIKNGNTTAEASTLLPIDTRRMGQGLGAEFVNNQLEVGIGTNTLSPGGTTAITAYIVDAKQELTTTPIDVTFSSPCLLSGNSAITGGNKITTINGKAIATYKSNGCSGVGGVDVVNATATIGFITLNATASLSLQTDSAQTISFVSATPEIISIKGTGGVETSTLRFKVSGQAGSPVKGICVTFAPSTTIGGLALVPSKCDALGPESYGAKTDANGEVTTIVQSGTATTPIRVTATTSNNISTQSSLLVVTTGIPDQNSMSLSLTDYSPVGWNHDGLESKTSVRMADAFNNPVPDGTAVTLTTSGGSIDSSCITTKGACTVTWRSQSPRPLSNDQVIFDNDTLSRSCTSGAKECRSGRVKILATAIGNESFIDGNGNGLYDDISKDTFVNSNGIYNELTKNLAISNTSVCSGTAPRSSAEASPTMSCDDLREAYVDKNFNDDSDFNEEIVDFNQNFSFDALPNGKYDGALCSGEAKTNGDCTSNKVSVRAETTLVMSCETPFKVGNFLPGQPTTPVPLLTGIAKQQKILLADCNGNGMPVGTAVTMDVTGSVNIAASIIPNTPISSSQEPKDMTLTLVADKDPSKTPSGSVSISIIAPTINGPITTRFEVSVCVGIPDPLNPGKLKCKP